MFLQLEYLMMLMLNLALPALSQITVIVFFIASAQGKGSILQIQI